MGAYPPQAPQYAVPAHPPPIMHPPTQMHAPPTGKPFAASVQDSKAH